MQLEGSFFLDHLKYVATNAQQSIPMAGGQTLFPVLIFAPGRGGYRQNSTFLIEALVSHGYVVVGIDQPYVVADVVFPDGRHVELDDRVAASVIDEHIVDNTFMLEVFDELGQDAVFALNQLSAIDNADPNEILTGRLDLKHVGVFGASLGGITTAEACRLDDRFSACLILDAAMPPDVVRSGLRQPTMWISADAEAKRLEGWTASAINEQQTTVLAVLSSLPKDGYQVLIPGMFHGDISDFPLIAPPPLGTALGAIGPADWRTTHATINAYSLAFFDKYLKREPQILLEGPSLHFPTVRLDRRGAVSEPAAPAAPAAATARLSHLRIHMDHMPLANVEVVQQTRQKYVGWIRSHGAAVGEVPTYWLRVGADRLWAARPATSWEEIKAQGAQLGRLDDPGSL
jgi:hypothetical protein